ESGQSVTYVIFSNDNPGLFSSGPAVSPAGTLTFTSAPDANGTAGIFIQVKDDGGTANGGAEFGQLEFVSITIDPVNDAPSFTAGANQTALANQNPGGTPKAYTVNGWATSISSGPPNESGQAVDFVIDSVTPSNLFTVQPAVSPTGT